MESDDNMETFRQLANSFPPPGGRKEMTQSCPFMVPLCIWTGLSSPEPIDLGNSVLDLCHSTAFCFLQRLSPMHTYSRPHPPTTTNPTKFYQEAGAGLTRASPMATGPETPMGWRLSSLCTGIHHLR